VVDLFGDPVATVRDLGLAAAQALKPIHERGVPDLLCHYHFLSAVGEKLFDNAYSRLRTRLRRLKLPSSARELLKAVYRDRKTTNNDEKVFGPGELRGELIALLVWLVDGDGKKYPAFPFGLPLFQHVKRLRQVSDKAEAWLPLPRSRAERKVLQRVKKLVHAVEHDDRISTAARQLEEAWTAFCELREVLRLTNADLCRDSRSSLRQQAIPALEESQLKQMKRDLEDHIGTLRSMVPLVGKRIANPTPEMIILAHLERHGYGLFGHPVLRDDDGRVIAVTERTNNLAEQFFGRIAQQLRRRVGRKNLGRDLQNQPAQVALVSNLLLPEYVRIVCGSLGNLPAIFARLSADDSSDIVIDRQTRDSEAFRLVNKLLRTTDAPTCVDNSNDYLAA
jgi:hypothetical protein